MIKSIYKWTNQLIKYNNVCFRFQMGLECSLQWLSLCCTLYTTNQPKNKLKLARERLRLASLKLSSWEKPTRSATHRRKLTATGRRPNQFPAISSADYYFRLTFSRYFPWLLKLYMRVLVTKVLLCLEIKRLWLKDQIASSSSSSSFIYQSLIMKKRLWNFIFSSVIMLVGTTISSFLFVINAMLFQCNGWWEYSVFLKQLCIFYPKKIYAWV